MIPKPGNNPTDVLSYRPITLLPIISKVLQELILKRINTDKNPQDWTPHHQFVFRQAHSTVQQRHHITDTINKALEDQQYCSAVFLDVSQAFDKVWLCLVTTDFLLSGVSIFRAKVNLKSDPAGTAQ